MSKTLKINPKNPEENLINEVVQAIRVGKIVAYPTETFYGLGVDVVNERAIKHLFDIKRRNYGNPIALIIADEEMLKQYVKEIPAGARDLMKHFWPGPLTILFEANEKISKGLSTNTGKIGIRISPHPVAAMLTKKLGRPITTTSANLSGFPPSTTAGQVEKYFRDKIDLIVDCGELQPNVGSTVIDVTEDKLAVIREGAIPAERIFELFQEELSPSPLSSPQGGEG